MAFSTKCSAEEAVIRLKEDDLQHDISCAWMSLGVMVFFGLLTVFLHAASVGDADQSASHYMGLLCVLFAGVSVVSWGSVWRDRRRLAQLKAAAASTNRPEQSGVWPPPPRATG